MDYIINIVNGKRIPENIELYNMRYERFKNCKIIETVNEYKETRRLKQNALYWKRFDVMEMETGITKMEFHTFFKYNVLVVPYCQKAGKDIPHFTIDKFLELYENDENIKFLTDTMTTTNLNTKKFAEYMDTVPKWLWQHYPKICEFDETNKEKLFS